MNNTEFKSWLKYHTSVIPSVRSWLDNQLDTNLILREWEAALHRRSKEHCLGATKAIVEGTLERPYPEDTASTVQIWASDRDFAEPEPEEPDTLSSQYCPICGNFGAVLVYRSLTVRAVRENFSKISNADGKVIAVLNEDGAPLLSEVMVACSCDCGNRFRTDRYIKKRKVRAMRSLDDNCVIVSTSYYADIMGIPVKYDDADPWEAWRLARRKMKAKLEETK